MDEPTLRSVTCASPAGLHRMAYWEWAPACAPREELATVVCAHCLTRNGRDFDVLARRLRARRRVICPDMLGRGASDRAADPSLYNVAQYVADSVTLIARLDVTQVVWVGTSMGGLIAMTLAALPHTPIARLILNDIGPELDPRGVARIGTYVGQDPVFATREAGVRALRELTVSFGPLSDEQFEVLSRHYFVRDGDAWRYHYDPAIAIPLRAAAGQPPPNMWAFYDAIRCPTLVLRGAESDLLAAQTAQQMTERGPRAERVDFPGIGHAPSLIPDDQIQTITAFLGRNT